MILVFLQKRLIQEIKMVFRVLVLYIPLPMFWALFDQQVKAFIQSLSFTFFNTQLSTVFHLKGQSTQNENSVIRNKENVLIPHQIHHEFFVYQKISAGHNDLINQWKRHS